LSAEIQRPQGDATTTVETCGLDLSKLKESVLTLGDLPVGARLILRCRKDWRDATVAAISIEAVILSVGSPSGHTYRVRRPHTSLLLMDGSIPIFGEGAWRTGRVSYDSRW
jgi:hypothetical protein